MKEISTHPQIKKMKMKKITKTESKYGKYTTDTQARMSEIETSITERYGIVPPKFNAALFLLADNLDLLAECRKSLDRDGLFVNGSRNPLVVSVGNLTASIQASLKSLGCTPYAEGLLKTDEGDEANDFVENLTK